MNGTSQVAASRSQTTNVEWFPSLQSRGVTVVTSTRRCHYQNTPNTIKTAPSTTIASIVDASRPCSFQTT